MIYIIANCFGKYYCHRSVFLSSLTYTISRVYFSNHNHAYKTLHSTSHRNLSERVGVVDTALSYEPEGCGFESRLVFYLFLHTFFVPLSGYCSNVQGNLETQSIYSTFSLEKHNLPG